MGQAAVRPVRETLIRHALAGALALLVNGALIALIILAPRSTPAPARLEAIDLVLIAALPPEPDLAPLDPVPEIAAVEPAARIEPDSPSAPDELDEAPTRSREDDDVAVAEDRPGDQAAGPLADYAITALPETAALTGTPYFIREVFCETSSAATREAGRCPDGPHPDGLSLMRFATNAANDEALQAALGLGLTAEEIRAMFAGDGLPLADLSGQPTLADGSQRPTSSADQMRDSLPPQHADPAFGD